jgi:hypothetical protein
MQTRAQEHYVRVALLAVHEIQRGSYAQIGFFFESR